MTCGRCCLRTSRIPRPVQHVGQANVDLDVAAEPAEFALQEELARLGAVDQYDPPRVEPHQLAGDLRADASRAAGHQQHAVVDPAANPLHVQGHRLAAEEVVDRHGARLDGHAAADQAVDAGKHADIDPAPAGVVHELADPLPGEFLLGDENILHAVAFGQLADLVQTAEDRDAGDPPAEVPAVGVDEAHDAIGLLVVADDGPQERLAGFDWRRR